MRQRDRVTATAIIRVQAPRRGLPLKPQPWHEFAARPGNAGQARPRRNAKRAWPPFRAARFRLFSIARAWPGTRAVHGRPIARQGGPGGHPRGLPATDVFFCPASTYFSGARKKGPQKPDFCRWREFRPGQPGARPLVTGGTVAAGRVRTGRAFRRQPGVKDSAFTGAVPPRHSGSRARPGRAGDGPPGRPGRPGRPDGS